MKLLFFSRRRRRSSDRFRQKNIYQIALSSSRSAIYCSSRKFEIEAKLVVRYENQDFVKCRWTIFPEYCAIPYSSALPLHTGIFEFIAAHWIQVMSTSTLPLEPPEPYEPLELLADVPSSASFCNDSTSRAIICISPTVT